MVLRGNENWGCLPLLGGKYISKLQQNHPGMTRLPTGLDLTWQRAAFSHDVRLHADGDRHTRIPSLNDHLSDRRQLLQKRGQDFSGLMFDFHGLN